MGSHLSEARHTAEFVLNESQGQFSRDNIYVAASQTWVAGQVLGRMDPGQTGAGATVPVVRTPGAPVQGSAATVGNGTLTMANPAYGPGAMEGLYRIMIVGTVAAGGAIQVVRPDGTIDGDGAVGVAYAGQIKFTLADGAQDWAVGNWIPVQVDVAPDNAVYKAHDVAATDGTQIARAVALYGVTTASGETTTRIAAITRDAEVIKDALVWKASIAAADKILGQSQLAQVGILCR